MIITAIEVIDAAAELTFGGDKLGARIAATWSSSIQTVKPASPEISSWSPGASLLSQLRRRTRGHSLLDSKEESTIKPDMGVLGLSLKIKNGLVEKQFFDYSANKNKQNEENVYVKDMWVVKWSLCLAWQVSRASEKSVPEPWHPLLFAFYFFWSEVLLV